MSRINLIVDLRKTLELFRSEVNVKKDEISFMFNITDSRSLLWNFVDQG